MFKRLKSRRTASVRSIALSDSSQTASEKPGTHTRFIVQGDKYYDAKDWQKALDQYAQAVKLVPHSDLYADLASCSFELQKYDDAIAYGRKAVELDPQNARAWGQLGGAYARLEQWITCFEAYDKSLAILKKQEPPDHRLHEELQLAYSEAKKQAKLRRSSNHLNVGLIGERPWERALALRDQLDKDSYSSAWVIIEAFEEYHKGYRLMRELKDVPLKSGGTGLSGSVMAIAYMTNGIVRDERCFYMESQQTFMRELAAQAQFEIIRTDAWDLHASEETVIKEATQRLTSKGWDDVRPALSTAVRVWMINAHISQGLGQYGQAVGLYQRAIAILEWGRKQWPKVSRKERGAIFDSTFVRGVRVLYSNTLARAYEQTSNDKSQPYSLREVMTIADRISADCRDHPVKTVLSNGKRASPVFIMSSQQYPEGKARMCKGYYYLNQGKARIAAGEDRTEAARDLRMSANEYRNASEFFPKDDEYHSICIMNSLEALFLAKTPLRETSAIITELRSTWAACQPIWSGSAFALGGGKAKIERLFQFQDNALKAVEDKAGALGDRIVPGRLGDRVL